MTTNCTFFRVGKHCLLFSSRVFFQLILFDSRLLEQAFCSSTGWSRRNVWQFGSRWDFRNDQDDWNIQSSCFVHLQRPLSSKTQVSAVTLRRYAHSQVVCVCLLSLKGFFSVFVPPFQFPLGLSKTQLPRFCTKNLAKKTFASTFPHWKPSSRHNKTTFGPQSILFKCSASIITTQHWI